jgi:hypothetical protein
MVDNPYEPKPGSPHEAAPRMLLRRGNGYVLPPSGNGRHYDRAHFQRQERIGTLLIVLLLVVPAVVAIGWDLGWWGAR